MLATFLPILYAFTVILLLIQAFRVMSKGWIAANRMNSDNVLPKGDRTGQVTVHPELLDKEGKITDEDLLTVRFSNDVDPPKSSETSSD